MAKSTYPNNQSYRSAPRPKRLAAPKLWLAAMLILLLAVPVGGFWLTRGRSQPAATKTSQQPAQPTFNKQRYSITDPTSPWVVVNKQRTLEPKDYAPSGLRTPDMQVESNDMKLRDEAATALEKLAADAVQQNIKLTVVSAYRSYSQQVVIYGSEVKGYGQEQADRESARPGHSEHQTGWAADLGAASGKCRIESCFADTPEGQWLAANAYKYGFIVRYTKGKEQVTGFQPEPWHVRYVGVTLSTEMHRTGVRTLEEFFGLPAAPNY